MKKYKRNRDGGGQRNKLGGRRVVGQTSWRRWHLGKALREGGRDETCREVGEDQPAQTHQVELLGVPKAPRGRNREMLLV